MMTIFPMRNFLSVKKLPLMRMVSSTSPSTRKMLEGESKSHHQSENGHQITRTNKQVFERKKWAKFGAPAAEDADESNVTIATNEDIRIESPEESEKAKPQIVASGGPGKYVPPSMRGGAGARANRGAASMDSGEREFPTLRVTNISEDTGEDDLKELFNPFGRVHRIYLCQE
ncbi:unnamed protein product [Heterosigma akashiwo]